MQVRSSLLPLNLEVAEDELPPEQGSDSSLDPEISASANPHGSTAFYVTETIDSARIQSISVTSCLYICLRHCHQRSVLPSIIISANPLS